MRYIKVWCEYDINGSFGGDCNEEIFLVPECYSEEEIKDKILDNFLWLIQELEDEGDFIKGNLIEEGLLTWEPLVICTL